MAATNPEQWKVTDEDIQALEQKLEAFAAALAPGERDAYQQLMDLASKTDDVQGNLYDQQPFVVGLDLRAIGVQAGRSRFCCDPGRGFQGRIT